MQIEIESILKDSKENMAAGVTWTDPMINGNDVIKHKYWASQLADSVIINCSEITLRKGPRKKVHVCKMIRLITITNNSH